MRDSVRTSVRTYVYLAIVIYLALLVVGGWLGFVVEALDGGPFLGAENASRLDELRLFAMRLLSPLARLVSRVWAYGGSLLLVSPLVSLGIVLALVAKLFFSAVDAVRSLLNK